MALTILPTELIENITNNLSLAAFRSIRLVCRLLRDQSFHHFKERFFRRRSLTWTEESFQKALAVTLHPYFSDALQELVIDATPRHTIRLWILEVANAESRGPLCETEHPAAKQEAETLAKYWNETRFDQKTLVKMFEKIKMLQSITFCYEGINRRYGKFARRYCERSQNEMSRPFVSTMYAITASGITVRNIYADEEMMYGAVSIGRLESLSPILSKFDHAFEQLRTLNLNLRDWRHPEEGFEPLIGKTPFVVRFLAKCKNIRSLELSCYSMLEEDIFAEMAQHCHYPHLEYCKLSLFRILAMDDLLTFLYPAKESLQSLSLNHVVLRDDDAEWPDLMNCLALELDGLQWMHLKNLFTRLGARIEFRGAVSGTSIVAGPWSITVVQPRLQAKLQDQAEQVVSGNSGPAWYLAPVAYPFIGLRV